MYQIIGHSFVISKETSAQWCNCFEYLDIWLRSLNAWLNDRLDADGYLSYETICDSLGIKPKAWEITAYKPLLKEQLRNHNFKFENTLINSDKIILKVTLLEA